MKFSRIPTGSNSLQNSLLDDEPIHGAPVTVEDTHKIVGQRAQVASIMADGFWHTVPALAAELKRRFGIRYAETSISARIREMRGKGWQIVIERTRPGSGLYQYRAVPATQATITEAIHADAPAEDVRQVLASFNGDCVEPL